MREYTQTDAESYDDSFLENAIFKNLTVVEKRKLIFLNRVSAVSISRRLFDVVDICYYLSVVLTLWMAFFGSFSMLVSPLSSKMTFFCCQR